MSSHWGRMTHMCASKMNITGSDNDLSPDQRQSIVWTNAGILSFEPLGIKLFEIFIEMHTFSFKKMHLKMSSGKWRPFCLHCVDFELACKITHAYFVGIMFLFDILFDILLNWKETKQYNHLRFVLWALNSCLCIHHDCTCLNPDIICRHQHTLWHRQYPWVEHFSWHIYAKTDNW